MARAGRMWPDSVRPEEQAFADLAEAAPSSAGFEFDSTGNLVVHVRDDADVAPARSRTAAFLVTGRVRGGRARPATVMVVPAQYSFGELAVWRDRLLVGLLGVAPHVNALDLDERANRVVVGLDVEPGENVRRPLVALITGLAVDTNAVQFRRFSFVSTVARAGASRRRYGTNIQYQADTLVGGLRYSTSTGLCTIGLVVDYGSTRSFLSASHCTSDFFGYDGSIAYQSGSPRTAGVESVDPGGYTCNWIMDCRGSDAALFSVQDSLIAKSRRGLVAKTQHRSGPGGSTDGSLWWDPSDPYFYIVDLMSAYTGMSLDKIGATSGWTYGSVTATCLDFTSGLHRVTCTTEAAIRNYEGDSGGPVLYIIGAGSGATLVDFVGLVTGRNNDTTRTYLSPYGRIVNDIGSMTFTAATSLSTPSVSGSVLSGGEQQLTWSAVAGASRYEIYELINDGSQYTSWYVGRTTSTSSTQSILYATSYAGTTRPGSGTWVEYRVYAVGSGGVSTPSTPIYFVTGTCTGRC